MAIDIDDHELVPDHDLMDEDAVEALLEEHGIEKQQLPAIRRKDPMAKRLNAEVGDVVRIERESPTAGGTTYYRRVVEEA